MVASSLLRTDSFSSSTSAFAVRQLILLLGGAMSALNTCVDEKEKEATVVHHCLASFAFIAAFVRYLNDDSISADFCRYVMSVLPCITETYGENELIVRDVIVLMKGLSDRVKDSRDCVLVGEVKKEAFEDKKVVEDEELKKKVKEEKKEVEEVKEEKKEVEEVKEEEKKVAMEETTHENVNAAAEEESDDSSYTYESYYSYETVSEEESMEPSMPSLVSAPDMEVLEEKGLTPREEEAWEVEKSEENATSVDSKKEEEWGFEDEKEKPEEEEEPVKEEKEEEWGFDEEEKTDAKKEEEDWGFDDKEEEKVAEKKHEDDDWGFDDEKEKVEKEEPVEEKKEEDWRFEEEKEEKPVKEEKVVEKEEDDWGFEEETEKPTEKKEEKPEEEEKKEPVKEKPTEEKPAEQKPVEEKKEQAASPKKEEVKPAEEKKEEKPAEPAEEKEIKPEASEKTEGSLATALARTEKKLEVDEHLWDDDDEPVKATRTTRRGRKKEKAQTERVVIETPLRSEKLFSDEEEEEERMAKKKARRGRMGRSKKLATFEASWEEEEKPVEKKEPVKEEKPVEKEEKVVEKEPVKEEPVREEKPEEEEGPVKEEKEEEWGFDEEEKPEEKEEWGFSEEEKKEDDWSFEDEKKPEEEKKKEEAPVKEKKPEEEKEKEEKKPVEEAKPVETEKKPEEEDWGFDDEKEEEPEEKHEEKEEKDAKEEKPVKEEKKEKEEDWGFDEEKENATVEKEEPTEKKPAEEKKAPAEENKAPAEENKAPAEEQKPSTQTHFTSPSMEVVRTTILTPSTLLLQACRVLDALLSTPVLLAQTCDCFKSYIPAVIADLPLTCYFVEKLVRKVAEKEWKEEDLNAMIEIVTILAAENESVLRSASDLDLELFLEFQKKEDVSSIPKQLVLLLLSFYQTHQQSWLIPIFIHIFTSALSHHTVLQVTRGLQYAVTVLQKLKNEDAQFVIATCGMTIIEAILDVCAVLDKEGLSAMVSFTALLYGKTDKKNEIVELVLHLCAISLKRSLELQPLNVKKCDEDVELVKLNSMIGELLFVMARVNPDSFKQGLQSLPAEKSEMLQNQLRRTVQVKQSESNAARRRNATRMPVKLDASKFTSE